MSFNWLDYLLMLIVAASVAAGVAKGFARSGIGLLAALAGLLLGIWFYGMAGSFLLPYVSTPAIANFIGFWIVFLACLLAGALAGKLLAVIFKWAGLSWLDRALGGVFGLLRGLVGAVALVLLLLAFPRQAPSQAVAGSRCAPYLAGAARACAAMAPRELRDAFQTSYDRVKEIWKRTRHQAKPLPRTAI